MGEQGGRPVYGLVLGASQSRLPPASACPEHLSLCTLWSLCLGLSAGFTAAQPHDPGQMV